jgi:transposase
MARRPAPTPAPVVTIGIDPHRGSHTAAAPDEGRHLDTAVARVEREIAAAVRDAATSLTDLFGIGPILAAKILGRVGAVARFPTPAHFASYCGVAPIEASSGAVIRHRLSRAATGSSTSPCT